MKFLAALLLSFLSFTLSAHAAKYGDWDGDEKPGTIIIITSDHTLHYIDDYGKRISYPIAVGKEGAQWFGVTHVKWKKMHPDWRPTADMRKADPRLPAVVPAGPKNPLGTRAIYLEQGLLRIHGTSNPKSIGHDASHGCFRMYNEDVEELYKMVKPNAEVIVIP